MIGYEELATAAYEVRYSLMEGMEDGLPAVCEDCDLSSHDVWRFALDTARSAAIGAEPIPHASNTLVLLGVLIGMQAARHATHD